MILRGTLKAKSMGGIRMDIRVLRYFLAVAREENITRAAQSLHIAQPSLSKQLMELEQELGKTLLIRGKRKITLTEEGVLLRKLAEEIVSLVDKTENELRAENEALCGEVAIGGIPTSSLLSAAATLRARYPEVRFRFFSGDATDTMERLDHGTLDFAILLRPVDTVKYEFIPLPSTAQWGLLLPADHQLAQKAGISRSDLCSVPLILHQRIGLQLDIAHWAKIKVEQLNIAATYNIVHGTPTQYVQSGLGAFLLTSDQLGALNEAVCFRPLDPPLTVEYALVWKRYALLSKPAEKFLATFTA